MAVSEAITIEKLVADDVQAGLALSTEAGWNQTADDWRHFIHHGETIGVRDDEGRLVASAAALPYDGAFGYVGMVLVTPEWQRRGIATRLVDQCINHLAGRGQIPVLDATAAGEEVYRKQGFLPQFGFDRWERVGTSLNMPSSSEVLKSAELRAISDLDASAFGARRDVLLKEFLGRVGTHTIAADAGFGLIRIGRRALQVGPVVASLEAEALLLLDRLIAGVSCSVFVDVPSACRDVGKWLTENGFSVQRGFKRMALGRSKPFGKPERLFAVAGPEFG